MTTQILVVNGKHGDWYYDASTPEKLAEASLDVLRSWLFKWQYIYPPTDPDINPSGYGSHKLETLATAALTLDTGTGPGAVAYNAKILAARESVERRRARYRDELEEYQRVVRLVEEWDTSILTSNGGRQSPRAYIELQNQSGGEYQGIELKSLTVPQRS